MSEKIPSHRSGCPISIALELIGDTWSLLVVRDLMFKRIDTFGGFLAAGEGIATNILTDRLARLEEAGIIEKRKDVRDGRRLRYALTRKGIELAPVLVELVLWSARHEKTDAPAGTLSMMSADPKNFAAALIEQWGTRLPS